LRVEGFESDRYRPCALVRCELRTLTIMQARTSSSRLPAKALLPVAGYPSAVLATLRAANQQHETTFATSDDASDDRLVRRAHASGLTVFRGPLDDVLGRLHLAASGLPEDCCVVRLTADNVVPDGRFVSELADAFASSGADYIVADSESSGLPYGLGGEAFSVAALRRAHREATSASDREHVTPWIVRNCRTTSYRPRDLENSDFSYLRCTIDDKEDYRRIQRLFERVTDPVGVRWEDLMRKLAELPGEPRFRIPHRSMAGRVHSELTLGTAQLGMEYGAVNDHGKPSKEQGVAMVRRAIAHGVTAIDTARAYGTAEEVLGEALRGAWASRVEVITKVDLVDLPDDATAAQVRARVDESIQRSSRALGMSRLAVVLLHNWRDHDSWKGAAWQRLLELRAAGSIAVLGASVYETGEALAALQDPAVEHLQIPMNALDWRWEAAGVDRAAANRPDVVVHARSVFLQGVLAHPANRWPEVEGFSPVGCIVAIARLAEEFGRSSMNDLCLAYVRSLAWVTSVVVGCETMDQLEENLRLCRTPKLSVEQCERLRRGLPKAPESFLNPAKWKTTHDQSARR
jgi:aryl-alcohol dehydrogenase-like predicted oxidoreductase/spore coat polysaccharide biosynthesis protein SpsF (cytidylyltransferase family)